MQTAITVFLVTMAVLVVAMIVLAALALVGLVASTFLPGHPERSAAQVDPAARGAVGTA